MDSLSSQTEDSSDIGLDIIVKSGEFPDDVVDSGSFGVFSWNKHNSCHYLQIFLYVSFFPFLVAFDDEVMKIWKYCMIFVYILQGKMGKTEKPRKKITQLKWPKYQKPKKKIWDERNNNCYNLKEKLSQVNSYKDI